MEIHPEASSRAKEECSVRSTTGTERRLRTPHEGVKMVAQTNFETIINVQGWGRGAQDAFPEKESVQTCVTQPVCPSWTCRFLLPHSVPHRVVSQQKLDSGMKMKHSFRQLKELDSRICMRRRMKQQGFIASASFFASFCALRHQLR